MKTIVCIAVLLLCALIVGAEESAVRGISLEDVRNMAAANSRSLAKYNMAVQSARLDEKIQGYTNLPSLSLGLSAGTTLWSAQGEFTPSGLQDNLNAGASFSLSQRLWDGGKGRVLNAINSISTQIARLDALQQYFSVINAADTAYYGMLEAAAALEAAEKSLETNVLSLSIAEIRYENRILNISDYLQAQAKKEEAETARNQARRNLLVNRSKLAVLIGMDVKSLPELVPVDFSGYEELLQRCAALDDGSLDALGAGLWKTAAAQNPDYIKAGLTSRRSDESVRLSRKDYMPSLSASLSSGLNYSISGGLEPSSGRLSLSGSIPLDFWVTAANVEKKQLAKDQAALDYREAEMNLAIELQTLLLDLSAGAGSVLSSRRACEYAEKHLEYVMELYRLSQNSLSDLSDAESLVSSNRRAFIQNQYAFLLNLSKLRSLLAMEAEDEFIGLLP
ncbi:MAG: TolC family protein [Treponema sp.]|jgi:outer membrane protein TolC|nr:TolC family protein [Treponema sp.]